MVFRSSSGLVRRLWHVLMVPVAEGTRPRALRGVDFARHCVGRQPIPGEWHPLGKEPIVRVYECNCDGACPFGTEFGAVAAFGSVVDDHRMGRFPLMCASRG